MTQAWSKDDLEMLSRSYRNRELVSGIVRSVGLRKMPVTENGRTETKEVEVAIFELPGRVRAYCPIKEFSEHEYRSLTGFTGTVHDFIIQHLHVEDQIAIVSVKEADSIKGQAFWDKIKLLQSRDTLSEEIFEGTVAGYNESTRNIFVKIEGTDTFMLPQDWDHGRIRNLESRIQRGEKVQVKIVRFNEETGQVQVSRKDTIPDPFVELKSFTEDKAIVGKVSDIDPIHGIYVWLDIGVELKGEVPRRVEDPDVGDVVSCRIKWLKPEERRGRVVILSYPQGKRRKKDLGDFLFTNG